MAGTAYSHFHIRVKPHSNGDSELIPTFVDRVLNSTMAVLGEKRHVVELELFNPQKNGKDLLTSVSNFIHAELSQMINFREKNV